MLIYGNTPRDIRAMIWRRRYKFVSFFAVIGLLVCLTGCGTAKRDSMGEFFKALGSGDISVIKEKFKGAKEKEDGSWDEIKQNSTGVE